jgi:transcriptional regulator with XRE-family HTH domain
MLIGNRIRDLRKARGYNQQELGDLLGVTKVSICGYENGTRTPSLESFSLLADVFDTTTDYLLGREIEVRSEETGEHIGNISKEDIEVIKELKNYNNLYTKIIREPKRYVSLINKKMR